MASWRPSKAMTGTGRGSGCRRRADPFTPWRAKEATRCALPMITPPDHIVLLTRDLEAGAANYARLFGRAPAWRVKDNGAETILFTLDNVSLELMSATHEGALGDRVRAAIEKNGE